ncbi:hypothetical protein HDU91_005424 [Kappamyces sp. JEL0680]|nr:hypothetical protein HDU91_005424 [Kappamyces sp. JEL0680]
MAMNAPRTKCLNGLRKPGTLKNLASLVSMVSLVLFAIQIVGLFDRNLNDDLFRFIFVPVGTLVCIYGVWVTRLSLGVTSKAFALVASYAGLYLALWAVVMVFSILNIYLNQGGLKSDFLDSCHAFKADNPNSTVTDTDCENLSNSYVTSTLISQSLFLTIMFVFVCVIVGYASYVRTMPLPSYDDSYENGEYGANRADYELPIYKPNGLEEIPFPSPPPVYNPAHHPAGMSPPTAEPEETK